MLKKTWAWMCRKIGLCYVRYSPAGNILLSKKATLLLQNMPLLDQDDLEKWFKETQIIMGSSVITSYLFHKLKEKKHGTHK